ncbi:MAG TPA: SH3 domain-containing protein, partial [Thermoanaerobaculia bacterium]
ESASLTKAIGESAARSFREVDMTQGFREMDSVAHSARLMGEVTNSLHNNAFKYIELEESLQRNLRLQSLESAGINATFRELLRQAEYKDWTSSVAEVAKQVGLAYDLVRRSGIEELRNRAELLGNLASGSPVLGMLTRDLVSSAYAGTLTPAMVNGFGSELMSYIEGAEAADSEEAVVEFLQAFFAWLLLQAQRLPGTKVSAGAILGILLAVLPLLDARYLDRQNDRLVQEEARKAKEEILSEMREMETRLAEKLAQMETAGRTEYIIVQAANLRKGPGKNFESLRVLPPNLLVEEIERDGEWSHVQYFDYAEGEARDGWISITLLVARHDDER